MHYLRHCSARGFAHSVRKERKSQKILLILINKEGEAEQEVCSNIQASVELQEQKDVSGIMLRKRGWGHRERDWTNVKNGTKEEGAAIK